jgi:hypothetical protein
MFVTFILTCVSGLMRFCDGSDKGTASVHQLFANLKKSAMETLAIFMQAFWEESMSCT